MDKKLYILVFCLFIFSAAVFCPVAAEAPIDDAYYWPETLSLPTEPEPLPADTVSNQKSEIKNHKSAIIEYTNIQDTTVTVKIRR